MQIYTLENDFLRVQFLNYGATIYTFEIKPKNNRNIVLSLADPRDYLKMPSSYYGATVGRVAGRIGEGYFKINGKTYHIDQNEKETNSLHGGFASFAFQKFHVTKSSTTELVFEYFSPNGEAGYPGEVKLTVTYMLKADGLKLTYFAAVSEETILNITNHSYFNLDGTGTIRNHTLTGNATHYYKHDAKQLNETLVLNDSDSPFYIQERKKLVDIIMHPLVNQPPACGFDHLLLIDSPLLFSTNDLTLEVSSNYPAIQMYSTNFPDDRLLINHERPLLHHALAIEPVDILSKADTQYLNLLVTKQKPYKRTIEYTVKITA